MVHIYYLRVYRLTYRNNYSHIFFTLGDRWVYAFWRLFQHIDCYGDNDNHR